MGKPFPHGHKGLIHDGAATQIIDKSFNVAYWIAKPRPLEIEIWNTNGFQYGVFEYKHIPFFLVKFDRGLSFEATFNIWIEKQAGAEYQEFLDGKANWVFFFLVNRSNNILTAIRGIGFDYETMDAIKGACRRQLEYYNHPAEVQAVIQEANNKYPHQELLKITNLRRLPKPDRRIS
jgi:hypothetical protein